MTRTTHPTPVHLDLTLDLTVNDESFAATDDTHRTIHSHVPLSSVPHTTRQYLRLGGTRHLALTLHYPAQDGDTLGVQIDIHETQPAPAHHTRRARLPLSPDRTEPHTLALTLPGDAQPYGSLTLLPRLTEHTTDPHTALRQRAAALGWTPAELRAIPGGHHLSTDQGDLYHDGTRAHALHAQATRHYHARGGPTGPLGLPRGDALSRTGWVIPLHGHVLTGQPGGQAALLTRRSWTHWQRTGADLGAPTADTTTLNLAPGSLEVTPCQRGTLLLDPAATLRVPARTLRLNPQRVTRWLQDQLARHLPPHVTGSIDHPWPGQPLRYPLTLQIGPHPPIAVILPLALKVTPTPDARRPVQLSARQAGLIDLPPGLATRPARVAMQVLEDLLSRPVVLATLPAGNSLVGAHVTAEGSVQLDFLPDHWRHRR